MRKDTKKFILSEEERKKGRERAKKYYERKSKEDNNWNRKRQEKYRNRNPRTWHMCAARCHLRKLKPEDRETVLEQLREEEQ